MKVGVVMGSKSDFPVVEKCISILKDFHVTVEARVLSAHRTPKEAEKFAREAEEKGIEVIVAAAGKAAHLAGVMAGNTSLPVIGIPMKTSDMGGLDSLLSTVQMPSGVPVATVAIGGGENAGLLAVQMLSIKYPQLREKFKKFEKKQEEDVLIADAQLEY